MIDPALLNRILRSPAQIAHDCRSDNPSETAADVTRIAQNALAAIACGPAVFGAAVGSWRGGLQIAFGALKMPLGLIGTLALCAPAFYVIAAVFGRPWSFRAVLSLSLVAGARFALVLLAAAPVLWLAVNVGLSYDGVKLLAAFAYGLAGLSALVLMLVALGDGEGKRMTIVLFLGIFLLVGAQNAWILRPYIGRPDDRAPAFFTHERDGGLVVQLLRAVAHVDRGESR